MVTLKGLRPAATAPRLRCAAAWTGILSNTEESHADAPPLEGRVDTRGGGRRLELEIMGTIDTLPLSFMKDEFFLFYRYFQIFLFKKQTIFP
jgi:hypothetical protein